MVTVRDAALDALAHGISVLPPLQDGSKAPLSPGGEWRQFMERRARLDELHRWYGTAGNPRMSGLGCVCGAISGNLEGFEFDAQGRVYEPFKAAAAELGLADLVERIEAGYCERSPSGGIHWLYRCETISGSTKLAQYESDEVTPAGKRIVKPLIECKGEGGFIILAPTNGQVHPTGGAYVLLRGGFATIATITPEERAALWDLARTFDEIPHPETTSKAETKARKTTASGWDDTVSPIDDYNERTDWADLLPAGWTPVYQRGETEYWCRPGKDVGVSATINRDGSDRLYVFSTSTDFEAERPYSKFAAYALLNHGNDFKAALRALSEAGYGTFKAWCWEVDRWVQRTLPNPCPKGGLVRIARPGEPPPPPPREARQAEPSTNGTPREDAPGPELGADDLAGLSEADLGIARLDQVKARPIKWLCPYRLERAALNMVAGDAGIGKSQLILAYCAAVSTGGPWLDGSGNAPVGDVVIVAAEDSPATTIKPRLMALGADMTRIMIVSAKYVIRRPGKEDLINFASFQDRRYWKEVFRRVPGCLLFVADPLPSCLGRGVNDSKNLEIREVMEPFLHEIIEPLDICMLGNTHLNKSVDTKTALHRISGSIAYGALPRTASVVVRDPDDPTRRYVKLVKANNAPDNLPALAFRIEQREVDGDDGETIETAIPVFDIESVDININDIISGKGNGRRGPEPEKTRETAEWLYDLLDSRPGPVAISEIIDAAGAKGFIGVTKDGEWTGKKALYRAKDFIPSLEAPRNGKRVETLEKSSFTRFKRWQLINADAAF